MTTRSPLGLARTLAAVLLLAAAFVFGPLAARTAHANDQAKSFDVQATVAADGKLSVAGTLTFGDAVPGTITQRISTRGAAGDKSSYVYTISNVKATAGDVDLGATVADEGQAVVVTVPTAKAAGKPITISYTVVGAVHADPAVKGRPDQNTFSFRLVQGLSVGIEEVTGTVNIPSPMVEIDCRSGSPVDPSPCSMYAGGTGEQPNPVFEDGPLGAGEVVQLSFATAAAGMKANESVEHHWSLDRAFSLNKLSVLGSLAALVLGGLALFSMHRRAGRDIAAVAAPTRVAEFSPVGEGVEEFVLVEDVRPGQIGTVADERVDPVDVTATLLDLAVRGHLRIHELDRPSPHAPLDWTFERRTGGRGDLHPYEETLLAAVAPSDGSQVKVSKISSAVGDVVATVQDELYDDVVAQGWFAKRPDHARNSWTIAAWVALCVAVVGTGLLVAFTNLGLFGLALIALALGLVFVAQEMPRRSAKGSELVAGLHVLASDLQHHRTDQLPAQRAYSELSEILPYAVVLGGRDRWLDALVAADDDPDEADSQDLDWYWAPQTWHLRDLPGSVDAFITTVQGHLFGR